MPPAQQHAATPVTPLGPRSTLPPVPPLSRRLLALLPVATLVLWAIGVWGPADHWASPVPRRTTLANAALDRGAPAAAIALLDGSRDSRQPGIDTLLVRAFAHIAQKDFAAAYETLERALRISGHDPQVWLGLCIVSSSHDVPQDDPCSRAVELGEVEPACGPWVAHALSRIQEGKLAEARSDLARCRAIDPSEPALGRLGRLIGQAQEREERRAERQAALRAQRAERQAALREQRRGDGLSEEAIAELEQAETEEAEREEAELDEADDAALGDDGASLAEWTSRELYALASRAVELRNDRHRQRFLRKTGAIRELLDAERPDRALARLDALAEGRAPGLEERYLRAEAWRLAGREDEARTVLREIAAPLRDAGRLVVDGCVLASDLEETDIAVDLCPRVDDSFTPRAQDIAANALGLAYFADGRLVEAEREFARSLAQGTRDELMWSDAALSAAALGDVELSLSRMRRALQLDEDSVDHEVLATDPRYADWRSDPRAQAALDALRDGRAP